MSLRGRTAIVTGGSTGLGLAIARGLALAGTSVAICARDRNLLSAARDQISEAAGARVFAWPCDVACESAVAEFVAGALNEFKRIDILINNAGTQGPIGRLEDTLFDEWRHTVETNLYSVFLFCKALIPHMRANKYGKIINLSGGGAASPRPFFGAYACSKAGVVRLTENLAVELRETGIYVNAIAPGPLNTRMLDATLAAGPDRTGEQEYNRAAEQLKSGGSPMDKAVNLCLYLASPVSDGITGRLISAPWDPWSTLHDHAGELADTDIYTLRRILPEDRAVRWN